MRRKRWIIGGVCIGAIIVFILWKSFPLISGYGAKVMCSAVFVAGRDPSAVARQDLGYFPFNMGRFTVDKKDSSVTGSVWGLAKTRAICRQGLGATLLNGMTETQLRRQTPAGWLPVAPVLNTDTMDWPEGDRIEDSAAPVEVRRRELDTFLDRIFLKEGVDRTGTARSSADSNGTRAVIVVYKDRIIGERYAGGFDRHTPLAGWSMTKGVTNALLGILVRDNMLDIRETAPVAAWQEDRRRSITIADLMHMRSGLRWWEFYAIPDACTRMLFAEKDMGDFATRSALRHAPGEVFNYSSGAVNILSSIIRARLSPSSYYKWPYEQLFYKIGMYHAVMEPDAGGTFVGSSYCYATARDWARFGLLYLHDGVWMGHRILPDGWVRFTREGDRYGALWWLNNGRWPHVPEDTFVCEGYEGQYIWVIPSRKLVVVRLALQQQKLEVDEVLQELISALPAPGSP